MRALSLLSLGLLLACDGSFSAPGGHPVPPDREVRDTTSPADTTSPRDTRTDGSSPPPADTSRPEDTRPEDTRPEDTRPDAPPQDTSRPEDTRPPQDTAQPDSGPVPSCDDDYYLCTDSDDLEACYDGELVVLDCGEICRDSGYDYSTGCGYDASYSGDVCWCDDDAPQPTCYEGWSCSGESLQYCDGYEVERWSCDTYCREEGYDYAAGCGWDTSLGDEACFCEMEPACYEGESYCASGYELEVCDGGEPWVYDCDDFCRSEGFDFAEGCGYDAGSGYDACYCAFTPCASWEFQCDDGLCLDEVYTCDGYYDCNSGEDELGCY